MQNDVNLKEFGEWLSALPIDVDAELYQVRGALRRGDDEIVTVAGDAASEPYSLLNAVAGCAPFASTEQLPFAVYCRYGSKYSIAAVNSRNETERFYSADDFCRRFGGRYEGISACCITADSPILSGKTVRFVSLDKDTAKRLDSLMGDSTACIVALQSDGGTLGEPVRALCEWIAARGLGERSAIIVTHAERRFQNRLLPGLARTLIHAQQCPVYYASQLNGAQNTPVEAVREALAALPKADGGALEAGVIKDCAARVYKKLTDSMEAARAELAEAERLVAVSDSLEVKFRAEAETDRYALGELLKKEEACGICEDVRDMLKFLAISIPALLSRLVEQSETPKADIRNLGGDYLSAVINDYFAALVKDVHTHVLTPRMERIYDGVCSRFETLSAHSPLHEELSFERTDAIVLRIADINLGAFVPAAAELTSLAVSGTLHALGLAIDGNAGATFWYLGELVGDDIEKVISKKMSAEAYAKAFAARAAQLIEERTEAIMASFTDTVFPRLNAWLDEGYKERTARCCALIRAAGDRYRQTAAQAQETLSQLCEYRAWLDKYAAFSGGAG